MTEDVRPGKRFEFNRNLFIVARSKIGVQRNTIVAQNKFASAWRLRTSRKRIRLARLCVMHAPIKYFMGLVIYSPNYTLMIYREKIVNRNNCKLWRLRGINFNS